MMPLDADQIRARLRAAGRTETDLARRVGKTKSAFSRIMTGERKSLSVAEAEQIEAALAEWEGRTHRPSGMVPVLGYAAPGDGDRILWDMANPLDWTEAPPQRAESREELVAVRVAGDTMDPRLFSGEMVYAGLNIAPARGGDVVIEFTDGSATVKTYGGRRQGFVFARQYNPEQELRYPETRVRALHAVRWRR